MAHYEGVYLLSRATVHVIDLFGAIILPEQHIFQCNIPELGASHGWSVVSSAVCFSD